MRSDFVCAAHDRLDLLDLGGLEEDVCDRDEQRALVDRLDDRRVIRNDGDLEVRLRLVQVAHRREVALLVHDPIAAWVGRAEAREHDGLGDRNVLVHDRRAGRRPDDAADLVPDRDRHLPPPFGPGTNASRAPGARVLEHALLRGRRHRAERVVDQVRRVPKDREPFAVVRQFHALSVLAASGHVPQQSVRPRGDASAPEATVSSISARVGDGFVPRV